MRHFALLAASLLLAAPAICAEPTPAVEQMSNEHWRCGPYRITIVPGPAYSRTESNQFEDYIVTKNGKRLHEPNRMRLLTTADGARSAWWEGFSGKRRPDGSTTLRANLSRVTERVTTTNSFTAVRPGRF
jgi:hypothetical protein